MLAVLIAIFHNVTTTQVQDMWIDITGVALSVGATLILGGWAIWRIGGAFQALRLASAISLARLW